MSGRAHLRPVQLRRFAGSVGLVDQYRGRGVVGDADHLAQLLRTERVDSARSGGGQTQREAGDARGKLAPHFVG